MFRGLEPESVDSSATKRYIVIPVGRIPKDCFGNISKWIRCLKLSDADDSQTVNWTGMTAPHNDNPLLHTQLNEDETLDAKYIYHSMNCLY